MATATELAARAAALHRDGKLADAIAAYDAILANDPRNAQALHLSAVALYQSGKLKEAFERLRESVNLDGSKPDALSNLGLVLQAIGHRRAASEMFERASSLDPSSDGILANLGAAYASEGRHAEAEAAARRIVARDATNAKAWFLLAIALQPQGRMLEALDAVARAVKLAPGEEGYAGLKAQLENGIGAPERSRETLDNALARMPMSTALRFELASLLEYKLNRPAEAVEAYEQIVRLDASHGAALSQLAFLRGRLADWRGRDTLVRRYEAAVASGVATLSPFAYLSLSSSRETQRRCARTWTAPLLGLAQPTRRIRNVSRVRIGYLSADFHNHATSFLAAGLFEHHDRNRFEVVAYSAGPDDRSPMRQRVVRAFERFVDIRNLDPKAIADSIHRDRIDVLVDLKGHTQDGMPVVLARRPAAVQVHYLGYPGTLEGGIVDYLIGDRIVTPPEHHGDYSEAIVTMPDSYQVNDRKRPIAEPPSREALGLPPQGIVFASFNQAYKINPDVFDAWMTILSGVPESVLWLLSHQADDPVEANLRREAQARGVAPERLVFARHRPNPEYLALYRHADLFLDTWPYNAHTTASDALWGGCPVLTVLGPTFASRVAASLLHAVGLPELVMPSIADYVARAIALARDDAQRARLRAHLAGPGRESALFDTARTTRALEEAYLTMVAQHRNGVRKAFSVAPSTNAQSLPRSV